MSLLNHKSHTPESCLIKYDIFAHRARDASPRKNNLYLFPLRHERHVNHTFIMLIEGWLAGRCRRLLPSRTIERYSRRIEDDTYMCNMPIYDCQLHSLIEPFFSFFPTPSLACSCFHFCTG